MATSILNRLGYAILPSVFDTREVETLRRRMDEVLQNCPDDSVLRSRGHAYGARNLLRLMSEVAELPRKPVLKEFLTDVLGPNAGLVRGLFFDKPPDCSWSLPWHKDLTIAVERNDLPSERFSHPTLKAGVPHVEAPEGVLQNMLTLRIHLDPMTDENGPLAVMPGSHVSLDAAGSPAVGLRCEAGDVLAMRPLLSHASSNSAEGTALRRRVIHLEFAAEKQLPDGFAWHTWIPVTGQISYREIPTPKPKPCTPR